MSPRPPFRRSLMLALPVAALASALPAAGQSAGPDLGQFERRLEELRGELRIPGISAAIARDGRIVWSKGFGQADVERGVAALPTTSYHLASLTKTFASTIILQLVEQGKLSLDDPVSKYGVELQSPGVIRVWHLFSHTSAGDPGSSYRYDGNRYDGNRYALLDQVVSRASGRTFAELLAERVLRPLKLEHTAPNPLDTLAFRLAGFTAGDRPRIEANLAQGYQLDSTGVVVPVAYPGSFSVSAGLTASALDVARYSIAMDEDRFLRPETKARAWVPTLSTAGDTLPYGLGWFTTSIAGTRVVWHYGYWTGNSSLIVKVPERRLTFVVLANSEMLSRPFPLGSGDLLGSLLALEFVRAFMPGAAAPPALSASAPAESIAARWRSAKGTPQAALLVKEVLALARVRELARDGATAGRLRRGYIDARRVTLDSAEYEGVVGRYETSDKTPITVARKSDGLAVTVGTGEARDVYPESRSDFFFGATDATVTFARDSTGRATTATLVQAGRRTVVQHAEVTR